MRYLALLLALFSSPLWAQISVNDVTPGYSVTATYGPAPSGTNRLLVAAVSMVDDGTADHPQTSITAVDLGATSMTLDGASSRYLASPDDSFMTAIGSLVDANIPGTSQTYAVSFSQTPETLTSTQQHIVSITLEGVNQTTPLVDVDAGTWTSAGGAAASVSVVAGGIVIYVERGNSGTDWTTVASGYTQAFGSGVNDNGAVVAYKLISSDGTENVTIAADHAAQGSYVLVSYAPAAGSAVTVIENYRRGRR